MKIKLIPDRALKKLDAKERAAVEELMKDYEKKYKNEEKFLVALKKISPNLYEKTKKFYEFVKSRINSLSDEAKAYMKKVIGDTRKIHAQLFFGDEKLSLEDVRKAVRHHYTYYHSLSDIAKKEVKVHFPYSP
ncbi:unnamed protein product [Cylicocyclus nassatus]|uniref:Fatty-acid and retinol-binding protein 1 n=1 Tax=Cylicocyclus nassatus TaxID=53992 RepID=A0AA36M563_CYLNA|nr:unnamed protein product [Cylicocyclus nassatus]